MYANNVYKTLQRYTIFAITRKKQILGDQKKISPANGRVDTYGFKKQALNIEMHYKMLGSLSGLA